jgi:hypothetical protein
MNANFENPLELPITDLTRSLYPENNRCRICRRIPPTLSVDNCIPSHWYCTWPCSQVIILRGRCVVTGLPTRVVAVLMGAGRFVPPVFVSCEGRGWGCEWVGLESQYGRHFSTCVLSDLRIKSCEYCFENVTIEDYRKHLAWCSLNPANLDFYLGPNLGVLVSSEEDDAIVNRNFNNIVNIFNNNENINTNNDVNNTNNNNIINNNDYFEDIISYFK